MTENKIEPNRKTIAEFIFIAELSSECICKYVELGENSESVFALFNDKIKWNIEKFYETYRKELYYENDSMFNGYINIDTKTVSKIFDNKILDEDGNEIKVYTENTYKLKKEKTEKYYKKHPPKIAESFERTKAYDKYLEQEFNTSDLAEINYLSVKDNGTFFTLLQTKSFLDSLCEEAEKAIKDSKKYEEEYAIRLTRLIEKLKEYSEMIISKATLIELAIRDWRTRVMECSLKVLKAMPVEKVSEYNLKTRAFVLKSLLTTLDIGNSQANIIRFIANIIGTSEGTVKGYFIDFSKDNHGMKKKEAFQKEMENALNMCNLLSTESENKRYVIQLIDAIKKIKDAQK